MNQTEIEEKARKLYPESYTNNWEDKFNAFVSGAIWMMNESEENDTQEQINKLKDEIWDLEMEIDDLEEELKKQNK